MIKKILVPVDFSAYSEYALQVAAAIAKDVNAEILVLHMIGVSEAVFAKDEVQEVMEAEYYLMQARKQFKSFLDKEYLNGLRISKMIQNFKIFSEISEIAKEKEMDLIVMGSHGTSGVLDFFVGSNTEKVIRTSKTPVLIIKNRLEKFKIKHIVLAWHFKNISIELYRKARAIADSFKARLSLVYINLPAEQFFSSKYIDDTIDSFMTGTGINQNVAIYNDFSVKNGVLHYAEKVKADMVVIPTQGLTGLVHLFAGSISEDLANESKIPIITFKI